MSSVYGATSIADCVLAFCLCLLSCFWFIRLFVLVLLFYRCVCCSLFSVLLTFVSLCRLIALYLSGVFLRTFFST